MIGISKRELLRDYYPDELPAIFEAWGEMHGVEKENLTSKESLTAQESQRLDMLTGILVTQYGLSEAALKDLANGYDSGNDAIQDRLKAYAEEIVAIKRVQAEQTAAALEAKKPSLQGAFLWPIEQYTESTVDKNEMGVRVWSGMLHQEKP